MADNVFKAIADPTRRAILDRLRAGPVPVNALAVDFRQSRPAISKHLRVLREASLASEEIARWWGSDDLYRVKKWTGDVRVGGKWKSEGLGSDGKPFSVSGEFLEIDAPRKLVHTWLQDWDPMKNVTTVAYRLDAIE